MPTILGGLSLPATAAAPPAPPLASLRADLGKNLPLWLYLLCGVLLFNTALTNLGRPRPDLAWAAVFPLGLFSLIQLLRAARAGAPSERRLLLASLAFPALLPPLILAVQRPSPLSHRGLLVAYELSSFAWGALLIWHAWRLRPALVALFFGAGLFYGALLENGGILLGFFHEQNLKLTQIPPLPAPLATVVGWSVVLMMGTCVTWQLRALFPALRRSPLGSALLVAVTATTLDLQIDPLATAAGAWSWHPSLPPWFLGVPRLNYLAWMCALVPFAWALFRHQERTGLADAGAFGAADVWALTRAAPAILAIAALLFLGAITLLEGPRGPSWEILFTFGWKVLGS